MKNLTTIILCILFCACGPKKSESKEEIIISNESMVKLTEAQFKNAGISVGKIEKQNMESTLKVNGKIDVPPQNMVSISVQLGGYLKMTKLLPGMHVSKGEIIAIVEDQQYIQLQQDYLLTKSKLGYSQLEYDRQKELNQSKASSDKVLQQAASELNSLKINLAALTEKLRLIGKEPAGISTSNITRSINIYAPISGFVSKVNVNIGKYVSPTDVLFELVNPSDIHLALHVFEKDLDKLFIGQKLVTYTNNQPSKKYAAEILLISKDLTSERFAEVHCHFEDYDKSLVPGTYMNAEIAVKTSICNVLPEDAVVRFEGKQYVFIKKGPLQFEMTEVQTGNVEGGFVEMINSEQLLKDDIVTKGAYTLLMSLKNKSEE